jgi:hypothetical protein
VGFDPWSLLAPVAGRAASRLLAQSEAGKTPRAFIEPDILDDLSLPTAPGLSERLHVPGLSGLAQGSGMATLGCLGLLAEAVLDRYITDAS